MPKPVFTCHVTGRAVEPLSIGDVQTVQGIRYVWFYCRQCDVNEHTREQVGFDATLPGVHVCWFDEPPPSRMWYSRWFGAEVSR